MQSSARQSHLRFPLTRLLASAGHVRVLRALVAYGAPLSVAQLAADSGLTKRGVRFVLDSLVSQGMVSVLGQPRSQLFTAAARHPLAPALQALFEHERARWLALQDGLHESLVAQEHIRAAWLYGSVARGEDEPGSDVDILLVVNDGTLDAAQRVRDDVQALGDKLNLHFSAVVLTRAELARLPHDDPWWLNVTSDAKVLKGGSPGQEQRAARHASAAQAA